MEKKEFVVNMQESLKRIKKLEEQSSEAVNLAQKRHALIFNLVNKTEAFLENPCPETNIQAQEASAELAGFADESVEIVKELKKKGNIFV